MNYVEQLNRLGFMPTVLRGGLVPENQTVGFALGDQLELLVG